MTDYIKAYWPIFMSVATVLVTLVMQWAVFGYRISNIESRQDQQANTISEMQKQVTGLASDITGVKVKVDLINDNVNYIRNRIDRVTQ